MKEYRVIYDTEHFIDGVVCESLEDAIATVEEIYVAWMDEGPEDVDEWNYMIYTCSCWVEASTGEDWETCWEPDDEFLGCIGWEERDV